MSPGTATCRHWIKSIRSLQTLVPWILFTVTLATILFLRVQAAIKYSEMICWARHSLTTTTSLLVMKVWLFWSRRKLRVWRRAIAPKVAMIESSQVQAIILLSAVMVPITLAPLMATMLCWAITARRLSSPVNCAHFQVPTLSKQLAAMTRLT